MLFRRFLPFLFPALFAGLSAQEPPAVVSTIPANGARSVSTKVGRILVVFDKDMLQGSMSLVKAGPGRIPPIQGKPRFLDARTFSIPLGLLKPGTTYSIGFNSARRKGFQSADNVPLAPYVLVFTTKGGKTAPLPKPASPLPPSSGARVIRTSPPAGSASVDPSLGKVEIWFSHDMNPRGMSLTRVPGKERLGYIQGSPPFFDGPRHLVIPVKLAPGTEYGVGINTGPRKGFVTHDGTPVAPFRLIFTTRARVAAAIRLALPAGRWVMKTRTGRIEHWFFPGGRWGLLRVNGKNRAFIHGRWAAAGSTLVLRDEEGGRLPRLLWSARPGGGLVLKRSADDKHPRLFSRLPLVSKADLTGTWRTRWGGNNERTWTFREDGSFACLTRVMGEEIDREGTWKLDGLRLAIQDKGDNFPETYGWTMEPSGKLALTMESGVTQFYERVKQAPAPPPLPKPSLVPGRETTRPSPSAPQADPLLGRWVGHKEGLTMEIVLLPGGRFTLKLVSPDGEETSKGTWVKRGSCLVVREEGEEENTKVAYRFLGPDRMEVVIEDEKILLTRQGKGAPSPAAPPSPQAASRPRALLGTWAAQDMTGAIALTLAGDGTFRMYLRQGTRENTLEGTWTASGGTIRLDIRKPMPGRYEIPYEGPNGDELPVTMNNTKLILKKQTR